MFLFWFMQKLFTQKLFMQTAWPPAPQWPHPKRTWALPANIFPHLKMILRTWNQLPGLSAPEISAKSAILCSLDHSYKDNLKMSKIAKFGDEML